MTVNLEKSSPRWRGVNHLALVTSDMDATVRFYAGVLGARLVATVGTPAFRHYFFDFGTNSTIAFFEYRDVDPDSFSKPAGIPVPEAAQFDHLSFDLVDEDALLDLRERLKNAELRSHRCRRPRLHPLDLLHRPERNRAGSVVLGHRPDGPRRRVVRRPPSVRRSEPGTRAARVGGRRSRARAGDEARRRLHETGRGLGRPPALSARRSVTTLTL